MRKKPCDFKEKFGCVGIFMGGDSPERSISLKSGLAVYDVLKEEGVDCKVVDIKDTSNVLRVKDYILKQKIKAAFIAMHGAFGEDGRLQSILEDLGIPYTGSCPLASSLAMDKARSRKILEANKIPVPKFIIADSGNLNGSNLNFPVVVKPSNGGSSIGLSIVREAGCLEKAFLSASRYSREVILEEYVPGEEITVGILENRALPVILLKPKEEFFNYKAKYTKGLTEYYVPAPLEKKITEFSQATALKVHQILGLRHFSRVDMILRDGKTPVVLEVNTIPGLTAMSLLPKAAKADGLSFGRLCLRLVELALAVK